MTFAKLDLDVEFQPLSYRYSKRVNKDFQDYIKPLQRQGTAAETNFGDAADFLIKQTYMIIHEFYKAGPDTLEEFEDGVTMSEISAFMREQIAQSGTNDILLQPLGALLQSIDQVLEQLPKRMATETTKAMTELTP